jgi:hypothetical protein
MMSDMPDTPDHKPKSEQHGKRGDPAYAQVAGMIPLELRRRFKAKVALEGKDMSGVLEELIREYLERGK